MKIRTVECCCRPDASAPVNPCYSRVHDELVEGKFELTGAWIGWKIRGDGKLYGPGGIKCSPAHLSAFWKLRRGLVEAMIADAFNGPTILAQLHGLRDSVGDAANDDRTGSTLEPAQAFFAGF